MTTESTQPAVAVVRTRGLPVQHRSVYAGGQSDDAHEPVRRGGRMRRLLTVFVFLAGGFAAEMAHPVQCSLINVTRARLNLRKD
ncbi:hypothetical protein P3T43_001192 [Paraburkholderia sp. GAS41]|jgi:hypothetical protein|uniref:hypothetical protein n=1 Tax=Paraburkholderia sp. GAS41 TaxID=3035134 RepID=UPI003D23A244